MDKSVSSDIVTATGRHQIVRYTSVVSMTILVTDWMFCFSEEWDYIWTRKWTFAEFLYIFTRFMPFVDVTISMIYYLTPTISPHECLLNYATGTWLLVVGIGAAELILVWRTYAIWGHSKKIMYGVGTAWAVLVLCNVPILTIFTRSLDFDYPPLPQIPGCYLVNASDIAFGSFASLLIMELIIVVLTVYKGIQDVRITATPLIKTLYRDGVLFFIYLLLMSLGNIIVLLAVPVEFFDLLINLTRVLHAILCCRVILHLRQVAEQGLNSNRTGDSSIARMTTLRFKFRQRLGLSTSLGSSEPTTTDESYEMSPSTSAAGPRETFRTMPGISEDV